MKTLVANLINIMRWNVRNSMVRQKEVYRGFILEKTTIRPKPKILFFWKVLSIKETIESESISKIPIRENDNEKIRHNLIHLEFSMRKDFMYSIKENRIKYLL